MSDWIDIPDDYGSNAIPTMNIKNSFADMYAPAVIKQESAFNPRAVSSAGAQGLMQLMPATGREMAGKLGMQNFDPFDAQQNETVGKAYLNQMFDQFGSPELAFAAYNAGPNRVQGVIDKLGTSDPSQVLQYLPKETQDYVPKVLGNFNQGSQQASNADDAWVDMPDEAPQQEVAPQPQYKERAPYVPDAGNADMPQKSTVDNLNDWASYALDWIPMGKRASAGLKYLETGGDSQEAALFKEALDQGSKDYAENGSTLGKAAAIGTALVPQMFIPGGAVSTLPRAAGTAAVMSGLDKLDDTTSGKDIALASLLGGGLGGGFYVGAKGVGAGAKYLADTELGKAGINRIGQLAEALKRIPENARKTSSVNPATSEAGAIRLPDILKSDLPELTKAEAMLLKTGQDVPIEKLGQGQSKIIEGMAKDIPINLPEATRAQSYYNLADVLANTEPTSTIYRDSINKINSEGAGRIRSQLQKLLSEAKDTNGSLIPADDAIQYAGKLTSNRLTRQRAVEADKMYSAARKAKPVMDDPALDPLLNTPIIQDILKGTKTLQEQAHGIKPENFNPKSFDSIDTIKKQLFDLEKSAKAKVRTGSLEATDLRPSYYSDLRNALVNASDFPEYQAARGAYAQKSKPIDELIGGLDLETGKKAKGLLTDILKIDTVSKPAAVGEKLLSMKPDQIGRIREVFSKADDKFTENLESGVSSVLMKKLSKERGVTGLIKYVKGEGAEPLKMALGSEKYDALKGVIELEGLVKEGFGQVAQNSKTAIRLDTKDRLETMAGVINSIAGGGWKQKLLKYFIDSSKEGSDPIRLEIAKILTDPRSGLASLKKMEAYRKISDPRIDAARQFINSFNKPSGSAGIGGSKITGED